MVAAEHGYTDYPAFDSFAQGKSYGRMNDLELRPAKQSFAGVWRLESYTDGLQSPILANRQFGAKASGILIYTEDGWVSAQLTIPTRQLSDAGGDDFSTLQPNWKI